MRPPHAELRRGEFRGHRTGRSIVLLACIGVALALGVVAAAASGTALSFAAAKNYTTGKGPSSVAMADLNGDRRPDLVTSNRDADTVSVLRNRGDGSFEPKRDYPTGSRPISVEIADLNADGKPELVVAGSTVSVLLNRGDGSFEPKREYTPGGLSAAIGDLNGDGASEIVTADGSRTVSVLINRGDGSFNAAGHYATGEGCDAVAISDVNGDGALDLITANAADTVSVLMNRGDGSFEAKRDYATGFLPVSVAIGDLNGDGKPDIVTANNEVKTNGLSVLLNGGDGSFRNREDYETGGSWGGGAALFVAIADLNGDGKPDLATKNGAPISGTTDVKTTVSVLLNKGSGTFKAAHTYRTGADDAQFGSENRLAVIDLNGDGKPDLATAQTAMGTTVSVRLNGREGSFESRLEYRTGRSPVVFVVTGDLNGDGKADVATASASASGYKPRLGAVAVLLNTPGLCNAQYVVDLTLAAAKRTLARVNCRLGKVSRAYSKIVKKGRVISQKPKFGAVRPGGAKVNLVVSLGGKR